MKKTYIVIAAAAVFMMFTGCGGGDEAFEFTPPQSCTAQITSGGESFAADFIRGEDGGWTVSFTQPESISQLKVILTGEGCELSFHGLTQYVSAENTPIGAFPSAVTECFDHAANSSQLEFSKDGSDRLIKGEAGCGSYVLRVSEEGEPVSLNIGGGFSAEFSNG